MKGITEEQLNDYLTQRDKRVNGRYLDGRVFRGTIQQVSGSSPFLVTVVRNGESVIDQTRYACAIVGYEPAPGDVVDLFWRSKGEAIVFGVVSSGHGGSPTLSNVNAGISSASVAGTDYAGIITFVVGGGNLAVSTLLFTLNFKAAWLKPPSIVVSSMATASYSGAAYGADAPNVGGFNVMNGDILGALATFVVGYQVRGVLQP